MSGCIRYTDKRLIIQAFWPDRQTAERSLRAPPEDPADAEDERRQRAMTSADGSARSR